MRQYERQLRAMSMLVLLDEYANAKLEAGEKIELWADEIHRRLSGGVAETAPKRNGE